MVLSKPKRSPLRYPGGKTRACNLLESFVIENFNVPRRIYSPFFGGGSFELHMNGKYGSVIIGNDGFHPLSTFWSVLKESRDDLCLAVSSLRPMSKAKFNEIRSGIMTETDSLVQASHYFVLNRCSFSGSTLSGGFSSESASNRFTESSIDRLRACEMSGISVSSHDFVDFLDSLDSMCSDELLYLDPPYYVDSKLYGKYGDMHGCFRHDVLASILKKRDRWLLCYNDCSYIRELYSGYTIIDLSWSYSMNRSKKSSEIVILCNSFG